MNVKKVIAGLKPEEIADAFTKPVTLTPEQRAAADKQIARHKAKLAAAQKKAGLR